MSIPYDDNVSTIQVTKMRQQIGLRSQKEDWTGKIDPVERRRLQNRLSQRAHRIRRQKEQADTSPVKESLKRKTATGEDHIDDPRSHEDAEPRVGLTSRQSSCINGSPRVQAMMKKFSEYAYERYMQGTPVLEHLPLLVQYNITTALARNAELLDVSADWLLDESISPFNKNMPRPSSRPDLPVSLHPTPAQHLIEHHPWLDLFPLPRMRDNFLHAIERLNLCNEDDLCHDLCQYADPTGEATEKATILVWGQPWDPRSWEVSLAFWQRGAGFFVDAWSFLMQRTTGG